MFDIGFTEMLLVAVVALVVLGPERLPRVARQAGEWIGKLQRYVNDVKSDINRQMELEELRKLQTEVKDAARSFETSVASSIDEARTELGGITSSFEGAGGSQPEAATDWDRVYALRRTRERIRERRADRAKELGLKRPKRR